MTTNDRITQVTTGQHGAATREQLLATGVSAHVLDRRVRARWLVVVHRTVYRLATDLTPWTLAMAAILATRARAVSHSAAAALWAFEGSEAGEMHVTGGGRRRVPGVHAHRSCLDDDEVVCLRGVPVTTRARTVLDLAGLVCMRDLEQALGAAERAERGVRDRIRELLRRHPNHAGSGRLRRLIAELDASGMRPVFLRSQAEELARAMMCRGRVPEPVANVRIAGYEVDFAWPDARLILEVDGYAFHGSATSFHGDRDRDRALAAAGYQVLRFTWRQLSEEPEACIAALCIALGRRMA